MYYYPLCPISIRGSITTGGDEEEEEVVLNAIKEKSLTYKDQNEGNPTINQGLTCELQCMSTCLPKAKNHTRIDTNISVVDCAKQTL